MKIPPIIYYISFIFVFISLFSSSFFEILASFIVLILIFQLFWRESTPPIILTGLFFQWLSVSLGYIYLIFTSFTMRDLLWRPSFSLSEINFAFWLSLFGIIFFSLGLKQAVRHIKPLEISESLIRQYNVSKIILFYLLFTYLSDFLFKQIRFSIPWLAQPFNALIYFKWSLLFFLIYISFRKKEKKTLVTVILIIEVIIGFTGYFSTFKEILILISVIFLTFNRIKTRRQIFFISIFFILLFNIGAIWSYVKIDYRLFLSGGERSQIVTVSKKEALSKLYNLSSDINIAKYKEGVKNLVKRVYFLEYFSATINNIPQKRPYLNGENWEMAIKHVLMPRFLFPNKKNIDDSEQTMKLTEIRLANSEQGTSISVGYMAESYADFGPYFMMIPIYLLGLLIGGIYKLFFLIQKNPLWSYSLLLPLYFFINIFGKNLIKIMGSLFWLLFIFLFIIYFLIPIIDKFFKKSS